MGLSAPAYLPLVALAAIPVIIHILSRLRLKRAVFPSLMLLSSVRRERFSWLRLKELLLLILRTLALLGLLLALARPYVKRHLPGLGTASDLILILDDSYSMSYSDRWARARGAARGMLKALGSGQKAMLLVASRGEQAESRSWQHPAGLLARLDSLEVSHSGVKLEGILRQATALARQSRAEIVVVTDLQLQALPDTWQPAVPVTLVNVAGTGYDNAGVTRLYPEGGFWVPGRPVRVKADLRNYSGRPVTRTAVLSTGARDEEKVVALEPNGSATVAFETATADTGAAVVRVGLRGDSLSDDDMRWLVVPRPKQVKVLVLQSATVPARYLTDALAADSAGLFKLTVAGTAEFGRYDPRNFQIVVVTDAAALKRSDWTRLSFHVQTGGSALVMAGALTGDSGAVTGPFRSSGTSRPTGFLSVVDVDSTHPVMSVFTAGDFSTTRFYGHAALNPSGGRVLARVQGGDPLILETEGGRLLAWAFAPMPEFTDLVYRAAFVPLLYRTLAYLASTPLRTAFTVGDTVQVAVDGSAAVPVVTPTGRYSVQPAAGQGRPTVTVADTRMPGMYAVGDRIVAVNVSPEEGDLTQASAEELRGRNYTVRTDAAEASSDLTQVLLYAAALAFALEMLLML